MGEKMAVLEVVNTLKHEWLNNRHTEMFISVDFAKCLLLIKLDTIINMLIIDKSIYTQSRCTLNSSLKASNEKSANLMILLSSDI